MVPNPKLPGNVCRICLKPNDNMKYRFDSICNEYLHLELFPLGLRISSISMFDSVCYVCHSLIKRFYAFSCACRQTQQYLEDFVNGALDELPICKSIVNLNITQCEKIIDLYDSREELSIIKNEDFNEQDVNVISKDDEYLDEYPSAVMSMSDDVKFSDGFCSDEEQTYMDDKAFEPTLLVSDIKMEQLSGDDEKQAKRGKSSKAKPRSKCVYTVHSYTKQEMLLRHNQQRFILKYQEAMFKCTDCYQICKTQGFLNRHIENRHVKRKTDVQCEICGQYFRGKEQLYKHMYDHKTWFQCKSCPYRTDKNYNEMMMHYESVHSQDTYTCQLCEKQYKSKGKLTKHLYHAHKNKKFVCDYCGRKFLNRASIKFHITRRHIDLKYQCKLCNMSFLSSKLKSEHLCQKEAVTVERKETNHKQKSQKKKKEKKEERTSAVRLDPPYCVECNKIFKDRSRLNNHFKTKKHSSDKRYKCPKCEEMFVNTNIRRDHVERVHDPKQHRCEYCNNVFNYRKSYVNHVRLKHLNPIRERRFHCPYCDKKFMHKKSLQSHIYAHTGQRPHKCQQCESDFRSANRLRDHFERIHLKIKKKRYYVPKRIRDLKNQLSAQSKD